MKKFTSIFLTFSLLALSISSCKKDDSTKVDDEEDIRSTKMSWKLDGTSKTSTTLFALKDEGTIAVYGAINDTESVVLYIENFHGTGTYAVDDEDVSIGYITTSGASPQANVFSATEGSINVTASSNSQVTGTFSGTLKNGLDATKAMTEGKFEAKIVESKD